LQPDEGFPPKPLHPSGRPRRPEVAAHRGAPALVHREGIHRAGDGQALRPGPEGRGASDQFGTEAAQRQVGPRLQGRRLETAGVTGRAAVTRSRDVTRFFSFWTILGKKEVEEEEESRGKEK